MSLRTNPVSHLTGLTARAVIATAIVVLTVAVAVLSVVASTAARQERENAQRNLDRSADLVAQFLLGRDRTLIGGARVFVQYPPFRATIRGGPREDVLDQAISAADQIAADWVFITNDSGLRIAKSDEPLSSPVPMAQVPLVAGALTGQEQHGFGASGDTMLFQAVALPIKADLGPPAGVLVATQVIDSAFLSMVKTATSSDLLFYTRDPEGRERPAASTVPGSVRELTEFLANRITAEETSSHGVMLGSARYRWIGTSLFTAGGEVVGGFLVLRAENNASTGIAALRGPVLVAAIVGAIAILLAAFLVSRYIATPMRELATVINRIAEGEPLVQTETSASGSEIRELQELSTSFETLQRDLRDKQALISASRFKRAQSSESVRTADRNVRSIRNTPRGGGSPAILSRQISRPGLLLDDGDVLANRYVIQAEVGRGGLGIVYRALDRVLGETVAVKALRPELALAEGAGFERLKRELRITRKLSHRNIVRTHDIGETDEVPFLTMEYVDGASLATIIASRGPLSRNAVLAMAKQMLGALLVAHGHGVIHGDLKPQNLLIDANGLLKITDFGVARLMRSVRSRPAASNPGSSARLTGAVIGTPEYMAPEQLIGEPSSIKSDLYAAGIVLKECLTGSTPYQADTPIEFVARKLGTDGERADSLRADGLRADGTRADGTAEVAARGGESSVSDVLSLIETLMNPRVELRPESAHDAFVRFARLG